MSEARWLDMEHYPRLAHFRYFSAMTDPTLGITVRVDVTRAVEFARARRASFYTVMIHLASAALNAEPVFRQRAHDGRIVEYARCGSSHIELLPDGTYCYCRLEHDMDWDEYLPYAEGMRRSARDNPTISEEDTDAVDRLLFVTTVPWLDYEQITMPVTGMPGTNPRLCWGKYTEDAGGRMIMPVSLFASHALADGQNFARFFDNLAKEIAALPL